MHEEGWTEQLDTGGPAGTVTANFWRMVACGADWGGWAWLAHGRDENEAREHLRRLERLDPRHGGPDFGSRYGQRINSLGDLDKRIRESTRRWIQLYENAVDEKLRRERTS